MLEPLHRTFRGFMDFQVEYHVARLLELETCRDSAAGELKAAHEAVSAYQVQ